MDLLPLWSTLPPEILERLLLFLPVPTLCRFRTVCQKWNSLITAPEFGRRSIQNARKDFIVGFCLSHNDVCDFRKHVSWSILDVAARHWYTVAWDGLLEAFTYQGLLSMDGGLVCQYASIDDVNLSVSISDPLAGTTKELPPPPLHPTVRFHPQLHLLVDNTNNTYKIFLFNRGYNQLNSADPSTFVYESTINQWRRLSNPPLDFDIGFQVSAITFQGLVYVLFGSSDDTRHRLCLYNIQEDAWEDTGVHFQSMREYAELVVRGQRLFVASWLDAAETRSRGDFSSWPLDISEISMKEKTCRTVFQMTRELVRRVFNEDPRLSVKYVYQIEAFGFEKSFVLVSKKTGVMVVVEWDAVGGGMCDLLPLNPVQRLPIGYLVLWYGQPIALRLPNTIRL